MNWLNRLVVLCDCNRPTVQSIEAAGFGVDRLERSTLPKAPAFASPLVVGSATSPAADGDGERLAQRDRPEPGRAPGPAGGAESGHVGVRTG